MFINRSRPIFIQIKIFFRVVVDEKFIVEREIGRVASKVSYAIAPNFFVIRANNAGGQIEIEVVGLSCVVSDPAYSAGNFMRVFMIDGAVKNFAVQAVSVTENR